MGTEADSANGVYNAHDHLDYYGASHTASPLSSTANPPLAHVPQGFGYDKINSDSQHAFVFLYCLANFFQNFGPNTTTFVIPGEAFPTRYRSTAHGISAASGKLGAILSQVGFTLLKDIGGPNKVSLWLILGPLGYAVF